MDSLIIKLLADGAVIPVVLIGVFALLIGVPNSQKLQAYSRVLMAGLTAYLLAKLIGSVYQPEMLRPFEQIGAKAGASYLNNPGFPSDHVLFCTAITLAVFFETPYRRTAVGLLVLTFLVGLGRVVALVHTPLDVAGGFIIALFGGIWYLQRGTKPQTKIASATRQKNKKAVK